MDGLVLIGRKTLSSCIIMAYFNPFQWVWTHFWQKNSIGGPSTSNENINMFPYMDHFLDLISEVAPN